MHTIFIKTPVQCIRVPRETERARYVYVYLNCLDGSVGKESPCNAGDLGSIPGSGRYPRKGNGNPLQYSCLEKSMDRVWRATVHGVTRIGEDLTTNPPPPYIYMIGQKVHTGFPLKHYEKPEWMFWPTQCMHVYVYTYISLCVFIHIYTTRERDLDVNVIQRIPLQKCTE